VFRPLQQTIAPGRVTSSGATRLGLALAADPPFYQIRSFTKCGATMTLVLARGLFSLGLGTVHGYSPLKLRFSAHRLCTKRPAFFVRGRN